MKYIWVFTAAVILGVGVADAKETCGGSDAKYYDEALMYHLSKKGVSSRAMHGGGLCVDERSAKEFGAAQREVDSYFYEVAHRLFDSCEERAFVAWATKEKLRFDVRPTLDSLKRPSGSMFLLRSFTSEEVVANRRRLEKDAPRGASCLKDKK
jgi:hypothetical protein